VGPKNDDEGESVKSLLTRRCLLSRGGSKGTNRTRLAPAEGRDVQGEKRKSRKLKTYTGRTCGVLTTPPQQPPPPPTHKKKPNQPPPTQQQKTQHPNTKKKKTQKPPPTPTKTHGWVWGVCFGVFFCFCVLLGFVWWGLGGGGVFGWGGGFLLGVVGGFCFLGFVGCVVFGFFFFGGGWGGLGGGVLCLVFLCFCVGFFGVLFF